MGKLHQGEYKPKNPNKYKGKYPIIFRSGWELKIMMWLDENPHVIFWSSENVVIPYYHPFKKRIARYFPDFMASIKDKDGKITKYLIEVKPYKETILPVSKPNSKKKTRIYGEMTYIINTEKWKAAEAYCNKNGLKWQLLTEKEIFKYNK